MADLFRNFFSPKKWTFQDSKTILRLKLDQKKAIKPTNSTVWNKVMQLGCQKESLHKWVIVKNSRLYQKTRKFHLIFQNFHQNHNIFPSKKINAVYWAVWNKVIQLGCQKESVHKWVMVKNSHFVTKNKKIHHIF